MSVYNIKNSYDKIIISFGGFSKNFGTVPKYKYINFLKKNFSNIDNIFFVDDEYSYYHCGIKDKSSNIEKTVDFLKNIIKNYKKVIFLGSSCGGYAAILYGSLLNIDTVITFRCQTIIPFKNNKKINDNYINLKNHINNITKYYIYGDLSVDIDLDPLHHISQCENIINNSNVNLIKLTNIDFKIMINNDELLNILKFYI